MIYFTTTLSLFCSYHKKNIIDETDKAVKKYLIYIPFIKKEKRNKRNLQEEKSSRLIKNFKKTNILKKLLKK